MKSRILAGLSVALLATTLGGCFRSAEIAEGRPGIAVDVPRECARLARQVPDPGAKEGDDGFAIAGRYRGAWLKANRRIGELAACEGGQANYYAKAR